MPYRKKYRKRRSNRRKGRYRGRRMKKRNRMSYRINRSIINPDTQYVKLRLYHTENILGAVVDGFVVNANSLFDPLSTLSSAQPDGFDQWAAMYSHYEVTGCAIKYEIINHQNAQVRFAIQPTLTNVNPGISAIAGNPYGKTRTVSAQNAHGIMIMKHFMRTKKLFGRTTASINFAAPITANPSKLWFWQIRMNSTNGTTTLDLQIIVTMTFYCKFFERSTLDDA